MKSSVKLAFSLFVALFAVIELAHFASAQTTSPNAYVYVINLLGGATTVELDGLSADSTGAITALPGSPFWTSTATYPPHWTLTHSAHWLFASDGIFIYSFSIASNGALTLKSSINAQPFSPGGSDVITALFLDHTWSTLYATEVDDSGATPAPGDSILAFKKNGTTGALTFLGNTDYPNHAGSKGFSFIGNNQYAYDAACSYGSGSVSWCAVSRSSDGTLAQFSINPTIPSNPNGNYSPVGNAADSTNNLAVALFLAQSGPGAAQLAVYTADSSGNLTTNSTAANMPSTAIFSVGRMSVSPAGNLLAVCGGGVQVFHFNGSNPITPYTKPLTMGCFDLAWDKHNHLYAIESRGVHVWRITPNFWKAASPYPLNGPSALTVLSK